MDPLIALHREIVRCTACPRLVRWRQRVAREKRRAYRDWHYWGKPVPGFGDPNARLVIVGLAPGAHGANRTGRMFTGDRSGDFLYAALYRAGFANQPTSRDAKDGLRLRGAFIVSAARCAPPENKPLPEEILRCSSFLDRELELVPPWVMLALGGIAWEASLAFLNRRGFELPRPRPRFSHQGELAVDGAPVLLGCYHVSQQNTQTGRLTAPMLDAILDRARVLVSMP